MIGGSPVCLSVKDMSMYMCMCRQCNSREGCQFVYLWRTAGGTWDKLPGLPGAGDTDNKVWSVRSSEVRWRWWWGGVTGGTYVHGRARARCPWQTRRRPGWPCQGLLVLIVADGNGGGVVVSYPTRLSLLFIFGFLYGSSELAVATPYSRV